MFIEDHRREKIGKKSKKGIFVGYDTNTPGFRVFFLEYQDVVSSSNIIFDDSSCKVESFTQFEMVPNEIGRIAEGEIKSESDSEDFKSAKQSEKEMSEDESSYFDESESEQKEPAPLQTRTRTETTEKI